MSKKEFDDGIEMEKNFLLYEELKQKLSLDKIIPKGGSRGKADAVGMIGGKEIPLSIKYVFGKNTQVHLTTLDSFSVKTNMPKIVFDKLDLFFGTENRYKFNTLLGGNKPTEFQEKYKRLTANCIPDFSSVENWFNENNEIISTLLMESINNHNPVKYLVWIEKNTGKLVVVDVGLLKSYIKNNCRWVTGLKNGGSTMRCINSEKKPIFHLQMKTSGGKNGEYNHNPQFHIHSNWPKFVLIYERNNVNLSENKKENDNFINQFYE